MCGFLAYIGKNVDQASFGAALATIAHRGPDSTQIVNSASYTFGFNRLAIQDSSEKSMQPMVDIYKNSIVKLAVNTPYHKKTKFQVNWKSKSFFSNKTILKNVIISQILHSKIY